jgi:hypothetical protein
MNLFLPHINKQIKNALERIVRNRTASSLDYRASLGSGSQHQFAPYTPRYAAFKKKKTGTDIVNLKLNGQMLREFYVKITPKPVSNKKVEFGLQMQFDGIYIKWGFKSREMAARYEYNARTGSFYVRPHSRTRNGRSYQVAGHNRLGKGRDFLGMRVGEWLVPQAELLALVSQNVTGGWA